MDNLIFKVYKINQNGIISAVEYEQDFYTREVLSKRHISNQEPVPNLLSDPDKLKLSFSNFECEDEDNPLVSLVKLENISDVSIIQTSGYSCHKNFIPRGKRSISPCYLHNPVRISLNIPTMIRCQNCETNFPTKYQYQRHQCEFNAEKVVLKANADLKDINKGMRIKYDCERCGKQFVSKNNLERHQICHENSKENICEHCNKQFVSENRLRIHKENHCKKVGDISKFYRSDVAVWKCKKCHEVFSSLNSANTHVESCTEELFQLVQSTSQNSLDNQKKGIGEISNPVNDDSKLLDESQIEKILTEILLQCEFCNRTYADKNLLLLHQRKHSTAKNYECVNCGSSFESYAVAAQHWLKICSETSNMFYLPKLTYCEYCDRTFKSHELLYAHKIKKKHYTVKLHMNDSLSNREHERTKQIDSSEAINKLIEDVLITLDRPIGKICQLTKLEYNDSNKENMEINTYTQRDFSDIPEESIQNELLDKPEKKKRGRKRKCSKPGIRSKKLHNLINEGYKYQCERCPLVWDNVADLEKHRDEEHAASFSCEDEDCGQVSFSKGIIDF